MKAILAGEIKPGSVCNRRRKLVALLHPDTAAIVGVLETRREHPPKFVERDGQTFRCIGLEVFWDEVKLGLNQEFAVDGRELVAVAIVACDGASKLSIDRIGTRDGLPAECKIESCMEISDGTPQGGRDRRDFTGPPIKNTFAQARELATEMRRQGFPVRRLHHPVRDHLRIHCVGRLVRRSKEERATEAREWAAACRRRADEALAVPLHAVAVSGTVNDAEGISRRENARADRLEAFAQALES